MRVRFKTEADRERHRTLMSKRHHARVVNATFNKTSLYSTLTLDNDNEVHTFEEARKIRDNYIRRLRRAVPSAQITIYMGRGKTTDRIHFHMLSNGLSEEIIKSKWGSGQIKKISHLWENVEYDGEDHGQDYTKLADYLFNHWTSEQGCHHWKQTKNVTQPDMEAPKEIKRTYTDKNPPRAPKGYKLVESIGNQYGYYYFKYVKIPPEPDNSV